MISLNAVKTIGIRIGSGLNTQIFRAARLLRRSKSEVTRQALEAFFAAGGLEELKKAARRERR